MAFKSALELGIAMTALAAIALISMWSRPVAERRTLSVAAPPAEALPADSRRAAVDELTAIVAHEIKQPLSAIIANVDAGALLWKQVPLPADDVRTILSDIRDDALRIKQILLKLRTLVADRPLETAVLDLNEVVAASRSVLGNLARRHQAHLQIHLAPGLPPVRGDSTHLQQVLVNLATNGVEAMAELPPSQRALKLTTQAGDQGSVVLRLSDSGPGIAAARREAIFHAFHSTKPQGLGMGLAVVKTIVEAHGGKVEVHCNEGIGAEFEVVLPTVAIVRRRAGRASLGDVA